MWCLLPSLSARRALPRHPGGVMPQLPGSATVDASDHASDHSAGGTMSTKASTNTQVSENARQLLSGLAVGDVDVLELVGLQDAEREATGLDPRAYALAKIAALVALDAPPASYVFQVTSALSAGVTPDDLFGVLQAIAPQVGLPRVVAAAPEIMFALGLSLPDEEPGVPAQRGGES